MQLQKNYISAEEFIVLSNRVWPIYSNILVTNIYWNIRKNLSIRIYSEMLLCKICLYKYIPKFFPECDRSVKTNWIFVKFSIQIFIRIFVHVKSLIQIYLDIQLCQKFYECHTLLCNELRILCCLRNGKGIVGVLASSDTQQR